MAKKQPASKEQMAINGLFIQNLLMERQLWLRRQMDPRRDYDAECGYPVTVSVQDYKHLFNRGDVASRVVSVLPEESWKERPEVFETEDEDETPFEQAWIALEKELTLYSILQRIDILSGIGQYGILLLGIDDGLALEEPAMLTPAPVEGAARSNGTPARKLLYVRPFDEELVQISELEKDKTNPRFGLPTKYQIRFEDANLNSSVMGVMPPQSGANSFSLIVHWTRVVHIADNRMSSNVYGIPRMQKVLNRLLDLRKVAGGSGEMFWRGGFPGLSLEAQVGENENVSVDIAATKAEMERYMNGLQRYIATIGMQAKSLSVQVADPGPHIDGNLKLIAMTLGIPWRVFVGSEAAQLASEQDSRSWNIRVNLRRNEYVSPFVIRPTIDRLIDLNVLPRPAEYQIHWPDVETLTKQERAVVAEHQTNAVAKYVQAGADLMIPPFQFLTMFLGMDDDEARTIMDELGDDILRTDPDAVGQVPPAPVLPPGRGNGNPARNVVGNAAEGKWVTISGNPVFIPEGSSVKEAIEERFGSEGEGGYRSIDSYNDYKSLARQNIVKVTPKQKEALKKYSQLSKDINDIARHGKLDVAEGFEADSERLGKVKERIKELDGVMSKSAIAEDIIVYRGFRGVTIKPGAVITDKGFMSTSTSRNTAEEFAKEVVMIRVPSGSRAVAMGKFSAFPKEQEILFARGSKLVVGKKQSVGGKKVWVADLIK